MTSQLADTITQAIIMCQERHEDHEPPAPTAPRDRFFRARATRPRVLGSAVLERFWSKNFTRSDSF